MQPYTETLAKEKLTPQKDDVVIGKNRYRAEIGSGGGYVLETGPDGKKKQYRIEYALGGKNVFYFLTPMDRGRLQTLPVAYDVRKKEWFDTALSGLRHFPGQQGSETPVGWQEWPYTFNTSCYGCHVSQLATNYDLKTDSYGTTWKEPGINCETCHGPSEAHNEAMRKFPKGEKLPDTTDFKIIRTKKFTPAQHNDACNSCHSKAMPAHRRLPDAGALLRPLRPGDPGKPRLLPRRPRPGGELHPDLLAHEPLRQGGASSTASTATPPAAATGSRSRERQQRLPPLPRGAGEERGGPQPPPGRERGEPLHLLPHADDRICPDAAHRPLHAAADPGGDHRLPVPQRLQRLPSGQGCRLGRQAWSGSGASATTRRRS